MHSFSMRRLAMLKLLSGSSTTPISSVQDHSRLNFGYPRKKSNNREKPRRTEKFIKSLTKSSRVLEIWELVPKLLQDSHTKVDSNTKVLVLKVVSLNTSNNSLDKEEVDTREEEALQEEEEVECQEVECNNLCQWVNTMDSNKECHTQDRCLLR